MVLICKYNGAYEYYRLNIVLIKVHPYFIKKKFKHTRKMSVVGNNSRWLDSMISLSCLLSLEDLIITNMKDYEGRGGDTVTS